MYFINGNFLLNENINAMQVVHGKITWLGTTEELGEEIIEKKAIDLKGKTVLPTLVESHIHPVFLAELVGKLSIMPPEINSIEEMIEALKKMDKEDPKDTIEGWGFEEAFFAEGRMPTCHDLDKVSTTKPVKIQRSDLHNVVVNSYVLEKAGIDKNTKDPKGGFIRKDKEGVPNGLLSEHAGMMVEDLFNHGTEEERIEKLLATSKELAKYGIGSITETLGMIDEKGDSFSFYEKAIEKGFLQDVSLYYFWNETLKNLPDKEIEKRKKGVTKGPNLQLKGVKYFLDGTVSSGTAVLSRNYPTIEESLYVTRSHKSPSQEDLDREQTKGVFTGNQEEMDQVFAFCKEKGLQIKIHAMGDYAVDLILELAEKHGNWMKDMPSVRIEHGSVLRDDQIEKIHELQVAVSGQSIFFYAEYEPYTKYIDEEIFLWINRLRSLYQPGSLNYPYVALSNDAPSTYHPTPANPWLGIEPTVTRKSLKEGADINQKEKLSLKDTLRLYTINAAKINGIKRRGEIKVGSPGNFMILKEDLEKLPENKLHEVLPEEVYIRGEKVV